MCWAASPNSLESSAAESFLVGKKLEPGTLIEAARLALQGATPLEKNAYKVPLTQTIVRRALAQAGAGVRA